MGEREDGQLASFGVFCSVLVRMKYEVKAADAQICLYFTLPSSS